MSGRIISSEARLQRLYQRRTDRLRLIRAYFYDVWMVVQEAKIPLIGFLLLTAINSTYLAWFYVSIDDTGAVTSSICGAFPALSWSCFLRSLFETIRTYIFEINLEWPDDGVGQALFFITPILGVALIFQGVIDFGRFLLDKGSRREGWQISLASTYEKHIIICGLGRVAYRVMLQLIESGHDVVVVEQDWKRDFVRDALKLRVPVINGDARDSDILKQAGLLRASALITGTSNDLLNIEIALVARYSRPDIKVVLRIFSEELDTNLERSFGSNTAFSSSGLAAPTLAAAAVSRDIIHVLPLTSGLLGISQVTIAANSRLEGFPRGIEEKYNVRVLQFFDTRRMEWIWPNAGDRLMGGDQALLMGTLDALEKARTENHTGSKLAFLKPKQIQRPTARFNTVIVCGLGKVGYRIVKELYRLEPRPRIVVVCDEDTRGLFVEEVLAMGIQVERGDARSPDVLLKAGLGRAYSIAAVTSNNLINMQIGLTARRLREDVHLVLRVFSDALAEQLEGLFGNHIAFSTSALAAPTLAAASVADNVRYAINIDKQLLTTVKLILQANDQFVGKTVEQIFKQSKAVVVALQRNGTSALLPSSTLRLQAGDNIDVLIDVHQLGQLPAHIQPSSVAIQTVLATDYTQRLEELDDESLLQALYAEELEANPEHLRAFRQRWQSLTEKRQAILAAEEQNSVEQKR